MKVKTTELTDKALDWAVGVAVGKHVEPFLFAWDYIVVDSDWNAYSPTTNWGQLGPIIETMDIVIGSHIDEDKGPWGSAHCFTSETRFDTYEGIKTAACRAIVAAMLGDQVDVPEVLL